MGIKIKEEFQANVSGALRASLDTIYQKTCPPYMDCTIARSLNLRSAIHLVGDIHQPMHAVSRYSKEHPHGDAGGNLFKINYSDDIHTLHFLWDSIVGMNHGYGSDVSVIKKNATDIRKEFPKANFEEQLKITDVNIWAKESNEKAVKSAYADIKENTTPSAEYIKTRRVVARERIALGGYRLALIFEKAVKESVSF
eukprot:TRINITY_DN7716_c0_g1_i4.p1 TRINITY_DN7716_c0_g1~~TRINITY_DN7716_c0_g1_i4.p1  ORF type:complete len:197 (-),score=27.55 TRINITY_DN7716_c0_g1_i4:196-786(-)